MFYAWTITRSDDGDWRAEAFDGDVKLDARGPTEEHLSETAAYLEQKHRAAKVQKEYAREVAEAADNQRKAEEARVEAGLGLNGRPPFVVQDEVVVR